MKESITTRSKTPWELVIEQRTRNIGFLTRVDGFSEPTEEQKEIALQIAKTQWLGAWAKNDFKSPFKVSEPYSISKGAGKNLKATRDIGEEQINKAAAIFSYVNTPMDAYGVLKAHGIDVTRYERKPTLLERAYDWFREKFGDDDYEGGNRLTDEFIKTWQPFIRDKK